MNAWFPWESWWWWFFFLIEKWWWWSFWKMSHGRMPLVYNRMHDSWNSQWYIYIYIYIYIYLKTETCANAPSLEHKSMSLKKKWFDIYIYIYIYLKTMVQVMIFENKWVRHVRMSQFDQKKSFWVSNGLKKLHENVKPHGIAWV